MDTRISDDTLTIPDVTVDVRTFAARAEAFIDDVRTARILRILVTLDDQVVAEIVGKGRTLKPLFGAKVGGDVRIADGDDLTGPVDP